jgi:hypothetical protein
LRGYNASLREFKAIQEGSRAFEGVQSLSKGVQSLTGGVSKPLRGFKGFE